MAKKGEVQTMMISKEEFFPILGLCCNMDLFEDFNIINEAPAYIKRNIEGSDCICEVESYKRDLNPAKGNDYEIMAKVMVIL